MTEQEKKCFIELMKQEEFQLPRRMDGSYRASLHKLLDDYVRQLGFLDRVHQKAIADICTYLKEMAAMHDTREIWDHFSAMMEHTELLQRLHIICHQLPIDGYGIKNSNLFRIRECMDNKNYARKDIFHMPLTENRHTRAYRYNIAGYPSLYVSSTIYCCFTEMGKGEHDPLIGSMFRLREGRSRDDLYIADLGVRPIDFIKSIGYRDLGRRKYRYTDYLYAYPLIAACSFIAANKHVNYIHEYSISNALFSWLHQHHADKICGVRYFSCAKREYMIRSAGNVKKESESTSSFTRYFINYALSVERTTQTYSEKLADAFVVTKPKNFDDYADIKDFETNIKRDTSSLKSIYDER